MKAILKQIIGIEFYRNIPFIDQIKGTPFFKCFFTSKKRKCLFIHPYGLKYLLSQLK